MSELAARAYEKERNANNNKQEENAGVHCTISQLRKKGNELSLNGNVGIALLNKANSFG